MDLRIDKIFREEMNGDTSFTEKRTRILGFFVSNDYSQEEVREIWNKGIKHGIEIGLRNSSFDGQIIEMYNNISSDKHKEFLDKFLKLSKEYGCGIQFHPIEGLKIIDISRNE